MNLLEVKSKFYEKVNIFIITIYKFRVGFKESKGLKEKVAYIYYPIGQYFRKLDMLFYQKIGCKLFRHKIIFFKGVNEFAVCEHCWEKLDITRNQYNRSKSIQEIKKRLRKKRFSRFLK